MLKASVDEGFTTRITCIDPFPSNFLRLAASRKQITLIDRPAQEVADEYLLDTGPGDLVFVDSTHTVKPGSEVNKIILEVLPRLSQDVFVHFHDITFPYDYGRSLLDSDLFFWQESALLHAFLIGNSRYSIRVALSMVHHAASGELQAALPAYKPATQVQGLNRSRHRGGGVLDRPGSGHFPSSAYFQVIAAEVSNC